ncbi:MAG: xanthine dehydrogenase accessory protein XdhC [Leptospirales bacterium]|nr:xanthine dehydrogenase accessory protein XdhC [Leptospirales bacterium]
MSQDFWKVFHECKDAGRPFVMATLIETQGSTPQDVGAKMLVDESGLLAGTIGGGKVEFATIQLAQEMIQGNRQYQTISWNLQKDIGMTCGGLVKIFLEHIRPSNWEIAIFGSGHVANALIPGLLRLNCTVVCVDSRMEWLDKLEDSPKLKKIRLDNPADYLKELRDDSFVLLMSQGHATDLPVLRESLRSHSFPYIGVIGSKSKRATLIRELREAGIAEDRIEGFYCPVGHPIGNNSPEEISVSIMAQLIEIRDRNAAGSQKSLV